MDTSYIEGRTLGIVGFGNLGSSIARALVAEGFDRERLMISCRGSEATLARARACGLISCMTETDALMRDADIVLIAARPQDLSSLVGMPAKSGRMLVSFMAGISLDVLRRVFAGDICRAMCSGPETIEDGVGVGVTYEPDERAEDVLRAAGMSVPRVESEEELDSFTVGICIPPILLNTTIPSEERAAAYERMASRYPVYGMLGKWADKVIAIADAANEDRKKSLDGVSTKGGITEAMTDELKRGGTLSDAIDAGMSRNRELCEMLARAVAV